MVDVLIKILFGILLVIIAERWLIYVIRTAILDATAAILVIIQKEVDTIIKRKKQEKENDI